MVKNIQIPVKDTITILVVLATVLGNLGFSINRFITEKELRPILDSIKSIQEAQDDVMCNVIVSEITSLTSRSRQLRSILETNIIGGSAGDSLKYQEFVQYEIINIEARIKLLDNKSKELKC